MTASTVCPDCKFDSLDWQEVDIGVGVMKGPAWCINPECGWGEETGTNLISEIDAHDEALADALTEPA